MFPFLHIDTSSSFIPISQLLTDDQSGTPLPITNFDVYNDLCVLPFSSGTTGIPKGVMLTHFNIVANVCQGLLGPPETQLMPEAKGRRFLEKYIRKVHSL